MSKQDAIKQDGTITECYMVTQMKTLLDYIVQFGWDLN